MNLLTLFSKRVFNTLLTSSKNAGSKMSANKTNTFFLPALSFSQIQDVEKFCDSVADLYSNLSKVIESSSVLLRIGFTWED